MILVPVLSQPLLIIPYTRALQRPALIVAYGPYARPSACCCTFAPLVFAVAILLCLRSRYLWLPRRGGKDDGGEPVGLSVVIGGRGRLLSLARELE
jgi:hypothetical protein